MNETISGPVVAVVLMGVCGSGKSTIGRALAVAAGGRFFDADDFHPPANVEKMRAGIPLTDEDRQGWLESLRDLLERESGGLTAGPVFLACSALKECYREILRAGAPGLRFVFLQGSAELIRERMRARGGHFMPETLIESQFQALEVPADAMVVEISMTPEEAVRRILRELGMAEE